MAYVVKAQIAATKLKWYVLLAMPSSTKPARPLLYLVDGSSYIYRAFHALPPLTSPQGVPTQAVYGFTTMLLKLVQDVAPSFLAVVFDAPGKTFRSDLYADYKANRPSAPDDLKSQIPLIHDVVDAFRICKIVEPGVEADDVIATLVEREVADYDCVIVTGDKDLMQLVRPSVRLWDTMRDRWIDEAAVREKFGVSPGQVVDVMALMGDTSDNIPGVKGIGAKTATALIDHFGSLDDLLERVDEVAELKIRGAAKVAERVRDGVDAARMSKELVTLDHDVPLDLETKALEIPEPDSERLREIFSELGFHSMAEQLSRPPAARVEVRRVEDVEAADGFLSAVVAGDDRIALGVLAAEGPAVTTPADHVLIAAADGSVAEIATSDTKLCHLLSATIAEVGERLVGYDLKRVGQRMAAAGVELPQGGFDVMVASYLVDPTAPHDLDTILTKYVGGSAPDFGVDAESTASGVVQLAGVAERLAERLDGDLRRLFDQVETPLVDVLSRIESRGIGLDIELLKVMSEEFASRLDALMSEIHEMAGHEFNINSPPQLRTVLFDELGLPTKGVKKGKTGYSTDVDVLNRLADQHPLPAKILEYRALSKLKSTYIDALPLAVNEVTGRLHTTLHQAVAATGRLSSSDPNLQNIPIRGEEGRRIRGAFVAPKGRVLIAADYSQIELRVLAHLSGDPVLREAFSHGEDIHTRTAAEVFGVLPGTVTSDMRRAAKVINFGILYGMGPQRLARDLGISMSEAKKYIANYFERYAGVRDFMTSVVESAREQGFVATILGRRRPIPELTGGQRGAVQAAERIAANTPIQGSAADIIKVAMIEVDRSLAESGMDAFMILQIHDELLIEAAAADGAAVSELVREKMVGAVKLSVPLVVDVGTGVSWAEAH